MAGTNTFSSIIEARAVGVPEINALTEALNKQSTSLDNIATKAKTVNDHPGFADFAAKVKAGIQDPLGTAGEVVEGFLTKLGPMGATLSVGAAAFAMVAKSGFDAMKSLGSFGVEVEHTAIRMGITTKEVAQFRFAAAYAGGDVGTFEMAMRKLSQEVEGGGKNLTKMGVQFRDFNSGALLPTKDVLLGLATHLAALPDAFTRNAEAIKVLGRAGLEILPELLQLPEGLRRAEELQKEYTPAQMARWKEYQHQIAEIESAWEELKRSMKEPLAAMVSVVLTGAQGKSGPAAGLGELAAAAMVPAPGSVAYTLAGMMVQKAFGLQTLDLHPSYAPGFAGGTADMADPSRSRANSLIDSALGADPEGRLEAAKKKLGELRTELENFRGTVSADSPIFQKALGDERSQQAIVKGLEAQIKLQKELTAAREKAGEVAMKAYEKRAALIGNTGGGVHGTGVAADWRITSGIWSEDPLSLATGSWADELRKVLGEEPPEAANPLANIAAGLPKNNASSELAWNMAHWFSDTLQMAGPGSPEQALRDSRQSGTRALGLLGTQSALSGASEQDQIQRSYQLRMGMAAMELDALTRIANRDNDKLKLQDAIDQADEKYFQARMEREQQLLQLALEQKNSFVSGVQGLYGAVRSGRTADWFKSMESSLENRVVAAAASAVWGDPTHTTLHPNGTGLSSIIPHAADGSFLGKVFQGTPFGADPMKSAGMTLNTAGDKLIVAAAALTSVARGGGGGAPSGFNLGGAGSIGSADPGGTYDESGAWVPNDVSGGTAATSNPSSWGSYLGIVAGLVGGGAGLYAGLRGGGARGDLTAAGSAAMMAASILPMISKSLSVAGPIGMAVGMGLGLLTAFAPDPKVTRAKQLSDEASANRYVSPDALSYVSDTNGNAVSYDYRGGLRTTVVNNYVQTMDATSFETYLRQHPSALSAGLTAAIMGDNAQDVVGALQQRISP